MRAPSVQTLVTGLILLAALALRVADPEPVARLRLSVFDTYQRLAPRQADPAHPVRVVDIDEASLQRLGQWPWTRSRLAELIDRLRQAGAKTVALDLILAEPDRLSPEALARAVEGVPGLQPLAERAQRLPSNDEKLAVALARLPSILGVSAEKRIRDEPPAPRTGFAFSGDDPKEHAPRFPGGTGPLPVLAARAGALGAVNWLPSGDQIVRRVPLLLTIGDTLYPSLALEQLRLAGKESTIFVRSSGGSGILSFGQKVGIDSVRTAAAELPTEADGQMWLRLRHVAPDSYLPAYKVLDGSIGAEDIADRHVLIGTSATGLLDLRATPLDASVPGVEIHAQALEQMLAGVHLSRPAWATGAELIFLLLAGAAVAWLIGRAGPLVAAATGLGAIAAVTAGSWAAFGAGHLFDPVYPTLALVLLYITGSLYSYVRTESERAQVRAAFSHYVAAPLVEQLAADPTKLRLGGEMRDVTVLFADVRGFSKLSEGMEAEELVRFVNALFTPLSDIILDEHGTIDKFMGDAVMAFWNAPLPDADHATNACRAALGMMKRLAELNQAGLAGTAAPNGAAAAPIRIGIGLNTGLCCAGNIGSPQRFDYSILGDTVNTASRLEEATKTYGTPIIAGESTVRAAPGMAFVEIGTITPRGKAKPERIHALVGDEAMAASPQFLDTKLRLAALVSALASKDKAAAEERLALCQTRAPEELAPLLSYYAKAVTALG